MVAESYVTLRNLTVEANEPIERIVKRAAKQLHRLGDTGILQLRLIQPRGETDQTACFSISLSPAGAVLLEEVGMSRRSTDRPTLAILTTTDSFRRIAEGSYSPVQAYLDGRLHLR